VKVTKSDLKEHIRKIVREQLEKNIPEERLDDLISDMQDYKWQLKNSDPSDVETREDLRNKIEKVSEEIRIHMMYYND